jgi:hypothetical protein
MIVECYSLHLYCATLPRCESDLNALPMRVEIAGAHKKDAWQQAKFLGWRKIKGDVYCRECIRKRDQPRVDAMKKLIDGLGS